MTVDREPAAYVGRFAPSPTGPLHFGSLLAAIASYLEAKSRRGRWLLRIEDIDPPRQAEGAVDSILRVLEHFGFEWDGPVLFQSRNRPRHEAAVERLLANGLAYHCRCTRSRLERRARRGANGVIYPGFCRDGSGEGGRAIRVLTGPEPITVNDRLQGPFTQRLETEIGDFIVRRRDGLFAYQLAVIVDDAFDGVTDVVRGMDLLDSTPRQMHLQRLLGFPEPSYMHIPLAVDPGGRKLGKQTGATPILASDAPATLARGLETLGQAPPVGLAGEKLPGVWRWALEHWQPERLTGKTSVADHTPVSALQQNRLS